MLVHCAAGVSRSASIVIAFVMRRQRLSFAAARSLVKVLAGLGWRSWDVELKGLRIPVALALCTCQVTC